MKCPNCFKENNSDALYCLYCGSKLSTQTSTNTAWGSKIVEGVKSKLFLALCILMTVSTACALFAESINVIGILATIFLWLLYSNTQKGIADSKNLRNVSGTIYASYVVCNVVAVIFAVVGILFLIFAIFASNSADILKTFEESLVLSPQLQQMLPYPLTAKIVSAFIWVFAIVFLFVAVLMIIINVFGVRYIHRTVKASYQSMDNPAVDPTKYANVARVWMWIFGIIIILSGLSSLATTMFMTGLYNISLGIVYILGALLINRCLLTSQSVQVETEQIEETIE